MKCVNLLWTVPEGRRVSFEMGSLLFSTKISYSFINIRICVCPLLKMSVLLQLSTFLLPISEVLDRLYFKSYQNLHINNGGVIFMAIRIIGGTVHWCRRTHFGILSLISEKGKNLEREYKVYRILRWNVNCFKPSKTRSLFANIHHQDNSLNSYFWYKIYSAWQLLLRMADNFDIFYNKN